MSSISYRNFDPIILSLEWRVSGARRRDQWTDDVSRSSETNFMTSFPISVLDEKKSNLSKGASLASMQGAGNVNKSSVSWLDDWMLPKV